MTQEDRELLWEMNYWREPGQEALLPDYPFLEQLEELAFLDDRWLEHLKKHYWNNPELVAMLSSQASVDFLMNLKLPPPPKPSSDTHPKN